MCPRRRQRNSRMYLPSKVKSGLDQRRQALTRKILFRGEQHIHNLLKLSVVLHHLVLPTITLRRSRRQLCPTGHVSPCCSGLFAASASLVTVSITSPNFPPNTAVAEWVSPETAQLQALTHAGQVIEGNPVLGKQRVGFLLFVCLC